MCWPGSVHDARIYANCGINKKFISREIPPVYEELVPGFGLVSSLLPEDPAYPLLPNLMKEYPPCKNDKESNLNNTLRSARDQIECAFARLKARWRILNRVVDVGLNFVTTLVYACFVLHNFCEINNCDLNNKVINKQIGDERQTQCFGYHEKLDKLYSYSLARGPSKHFNVVSTLSFG